MTTRSSRPGTPRPRIQLALALAAAVCACQPGYAQTSPPSEATKQAFQRFQQAGPTVALSVLPAQLLKRPETNVGNTIGLLLERSGLHHVEPAPGAFKPADDTTWDNLAARFTEHLQKNPVPTAYALYAEIIGTRETGLVELRWIVAEAGGQIVLAERLTPENPEFKRLLGTSPEPMTCCVAVAERLFSLTGWKKGGAPPKGQGTFERIWADRSGTPDDAEATAMSERLAKFKAGLKGSTLAIAPTRLGDKDDPQSATRLSAAIARKFDCKATVLEAPIRIEIAGSMNEQRVLWDFARALRQHLKTNPPQADYVLMADCRGNPAANEFGAVHFVVCDKEGNWVLVDYQNSHHPDFQRMTPRSAEDCEALIAVRLAARLR